MGLCLGSLPVLHTPGRFLGRERAVRMESSKVLDFLFQDIGFCRSPTLGWLMHSLT